MVVRLFFIVAQTARIFLRSVDQIRPASKCGVAAAAAAEEAGRLGLRQQDIYLLKWTVGVCGGVELKFGVQAGHIRALWVAGSSATGG